MNQGFFTSKQTQSVTRPDRRSHSCAYCGLSKNCKTPRMKPFGNFKKGILNIGEAPGEMEDQRGKPWQGKTGRALQLKYEQLGIDLFEDCLNINACLCRPVDKEGNNRTPTNAEIDNCRRIVLQTIEEHQPKLIVLFGNGALYSLIGHRWKKDLGGITKWRGWTIPDQDFKCWICPTFHPSYVERSTGSVEDRIWEDDLRQALSKLNEPFPRYHKPKIEIIEDLSVLSNTKSDIVAIDYETTGLKPQANGHRVVCVAVADSPDHSYAFMLPPSKNGRKPFTDLLGNIMINKVAQNMKYEDMWSSVRLRQPVQGWLWDTMLTTHLLDNRTGITGLKFQTYVQFGVVDYDSEVAPYLQSIDKDGNALNRIEQLVKIPGGKEKLMHYCGLDTIHTYRLAMQQMELIGYDTLPF